MTDLHVECVDIGRWRKLCEAFADYNYRQVWGFGQACAERVAAVSEHVAVSCGAHVLALADVRIKRTPVLHAGIAYINGGPLVRRSAQGDPELAALAIRALHREFVIERRLLLRIAPSPAPPHWNELQAELYKRAGFSEKAGAQRYRTILIELALPAPELRKALNAKWRNHLNQAERGGFTLRTGQDAETVAAFCRLYNELLERKEFAVDLDAAFYARVQTQLADSEKFEVTLAERDGELLAGHVAALHGDTGVYLLGASSPAGLKSRASFLLQWESLTRARQRGFRWYDLGGIDPLNNPGVYTFKHGMGGVELDVPGPFEAAPGELRRLLVSGGERVYRAMRARLGAAR